MKFFKIILLFVTLILNSCSEKFEKLSEINSDRDELLKQIQTESKIKYWQLEHFPNYKDENENSEILYSKGQCSEKEKANIPNNERNWNGFFSGCQPSFCAYRITYLENNNWKTVTSEEELKNFIGEINNVSEAFLIGEINDYSVDFNSEKGNGYIKETNGFTVKMMKYNNCPESKESFTFFVNKNGSITNLKSNGYYLKSKNCIVY